MTVRSETIAQPHVRLTGRAALLVIVVAMLGMVALVPVRQYLAQRTEIEQLERRTDKLERANDALRSDVARLHDPEHLERLARACLGMVEPDEVAFVSKASGTDPTC